jgi:hypothetical protein
MWQPYRRWLDVGKNFSTIARKTLTAATPWESLLDLFLSPGKRPRRKIHSRSFKVLDAV